MKVSVIVPVYGVEEYLDKCVASIVNQTYRDIEIFLIDDGGKDRCPQMCDEWAKKDDRIIVIHKVNEGQGVARNVALNRASGDYVLFVDSDDEILPEMVEKLVIATDGGTIDIALCGYVAREFSRIISPPWYAEPRILLNRELMGEYLTSGYITSAPWCKLIAMRIMQHIRFPSFRANEDAYVLHEIFGRCNRSSVITYRGYIQNLRQGSTEASRFNIHKMHLLDCAEATQCYVLKNYPEYAEHVATHKASACLSLLRKMYECKDREKFAEYEQQVREILISEKDTLCVIPAKHREATMYLFHRSRYIRMVKRHQRKTKLKNIIKRILEKFKKRNF